MTEAQIKMCAQCHQAKPISEFHTKMRPDGSTYVYAQCKICHRRYARAHYAANRREYIDRAKNRKSALVPVARDFLAGYLAERPCVDCGESDLVVLQFDHCRGTKVANVSRMIKDGWSLLTIQEEIAKCDVVCANCHARRTARRSGWWNLNLGPVAQRIEQQLTKL